MCLLDSKHIFIIVLLEDKFINRNQKTFWSKTCETRGFTVNSSFLEKIPKIWFIKNQTLPSPKNNWLVSELTPPPVESSWCCNHLHFYSRGAPCWRISSCTQVLPITRDTLVSNPRTWLPSNSRYEYQSTQKALPHQKDQSSQPTTIFWLVLGLLPTQDNSIIRFLH